MPQPICRRRTGFVGFTLAELMVVVAIIGVLIAILVPVVGKVRAKAHDANAQNFINQLAGAIDRYHQDFQAYPGPLTNDQIWTNTNPFPLGPFAAFNVGTNSSGYANAPWTPTQITQNENFVLGLLGGLKTVVSGTTVNLVYEPSLVGGGAMSLNPQNPKRYEPYLPDAAKFLSWHTDNGLRTGSYTDDSCPKIADTIIPEFVDPYPDPMPILILRARPGMVPQNAVNSQNVSEAVNGVVNKVGVKGNGQQYDLDQIIAYTGSYNDSGATETTPSGDPNGAGYPRSVGVGKKVPTYFYNNAVTTPGNPYHGLRLTGISGPGQVATLTPSTYYAYPLPAFPYLQNPQIPFTPRQKDGYILICAGSDRMYGTNDDIVSFGSVQP
jgi:prepilin-type N-terminal cleavage/methylation domain-containing protein